VTPAPDCAPDRQPQLPREVVGLVEPPLEEADGMKWHRHDRVRAVEDVRAGQSHHASQRFGQDSAALVLERLNHAPQRAVVPPGASSEREGRRASAAPRAFRIGRPPCGELVSAPDTPRR
jgi:hypothetical protein